MEKLHFPIRTDFDSILRARVDTFFKEKSILPSGTTTLHIKALSLLAFMGVFYYFLVFQCNNYLGALFLTFFLVQFKILLAFNVMHDGGHYSFSRKKWLNDLAAFSMELLGSSSMLWRQKHNSLHHTYTNINGKDDDIDIGNLIRLSPQQEKKPWHRFQHFYAPFLYSLLSLYLLFYSDFQKIFSKKIGNTPLNISSKREILIFFLSKFLYLAYTLFIPMIWHSPLVVISLFIFGHLIFGLTLSIVFQLAHTVKETKFPTPDEKGNLPYSWSEHQLNTTANFAVNNKFLTFYCGGLNHQVEHHLFHRISHVHYPEISKIVSQTCKEFNKPYHVNPSFWKALKSHFNFLRSMGS